MSDTLASQAVTPPDPSKITQFLLKAMAITAVFSKKAGIWSLQKLRIGGTHLLTAAARMAKAIASIKLPVRHSTHMRLMNQLGRFEREVISSVRTIECREKRTRTFLSLARTAYEIGRNNEPFLKAAVEELGVEQYWMRKQRRIFSAAQLACAVAGLAARSGHRQRASEAYLFGQTFYGKVDGVDRKIGLACVFADVANLMDTYSDRVSWLATAMDLACGIEDKAERLGAVSFVARKMVNDQVAPFENPLVDKRFIVDVAAMAKITVIEETPRTLPKAAHDEFALEMP